MFYVWLYVKVVHVNVIISRIKKAKNDDKSFDFHLHIIYWATAFSMQPAVSKSALNQSYTDLYGILASLNYIH